MTLKVHVILHNFHDYFELSGKTFKYTSDEFTAATHSQLRIHKEAHRFKVVRRLGTPDHVNKSLQSIATFNALRAGFSPEGSLRLRNKLFI